MQTTPTEEKAIAEFQALAKRWPKTLWLFSASGTLNIMKKVNGNRGYTDNGGVDPDLCVSVVDIENDGGDW